MPVPTAALVVLTDVERETLERWARRHSSAQALALRCRIVLACAEGGTNTEVAQRLGVTRATVAKWRTRFVERRLDGLHERGNEVLETVGLLRRREDRVGELSHGDKRKLELAMVLAADPELLLLDEPTAGVSAEETAPLVEVIQDVHRSGRAIVMVEHRMEFVVDVSERIAVMHEGKLLTVGSPTEVMADERVRTAYLGGRR